MADSGDFILTAPRARAIRDIIVQDEVALEKWAVVKDEFVNLGDGRQIREWCRNHEYGKAILETLNKWKSDCGPNATFGSLLKILRLYGLNSVVGDLESKKKEIFNAPAQSASTKIYHDIEDFRIPYASAVAIRNTIMRDPIALGRWGSVKDDLVADETTKFNMLTESDTIEETILRTIRSWIMSLREKATFNLLLEVITKHGLRALFDELKKMAKTFEEIEVQAIKDKSGNEPVQTVSNVELQPGRPVAVVMPNVVDASQANSDDADDKNRNDEMYDVQSNRKLSPRAI